MVNTASREGRATVFVSDTGTPQLWSDGIDAFLDPEILMEYARSGRSLFPNAQRFSGDVNAATLTRSFSGETALSQVTVVAGEKTARATITFAANGFLALEFGDQNADTQVSAISIPVTQRILMECSVSADVAPWIMAPETREAWWSPHFFRMLGYEDGGFEHTSYAFRQLIHPDQLESAIQSMDALIAGVTDRYHAVFRLRHKDGSWRWHEATARLARLPDGSDVVCGGLKDVHAWRESELERDRLFEENKLARAEAEAAQAAARQNEALLRTSVASGEQTAWCACAATGEAWMMDEGYRMMGYGPDEFRPDSEGWRSIIHPDDLDEGVVKMKALVSGAADIYRHDNRLRHKSGDYHWYRVVARMIDRADEGLPPLMAGTTIRIDTLKENEERLSDALRHAEQLRNEAEATEQLLRTAVTCGEFGLWSFGVDNDDCWMMDETFQLLGYEAGAFVPNGEGWHDLIHPDDRTKSDEALSALISGESENYDVEERLRQGDGSYRWYRTVARLITRPTDDARIIAGTFSDISELKSKQADLENAVSEVTAARAEWQETAEILRVSSESSNVIPWIRSPATGESWFADNLAEVLGLEPGTKVTSQIFRAFLHPDELDEIYAQFARLESRETDIFDMEHRIRGADGAWFWVQSRGRWVERQADGRNSIICGSFMNVDKIKEQQAELAKAVVDAEGARADALQTAEILRVSSENSGVVPWFRVPETDEFWFAPNIAEFSGFPSGTEISLSDWIGRLHPEDLPLVAAAIEAIESFQTDTFNVEFRSMNAQGNYFWCRSIGRRICRSEQQLPDLICGAQFSIDELKKSELRQAEAAAELKATNARLTTIADNAPAGIFEFRKYSDGTFEFPYTSAKFSDLFGLTPEAIAERPQIPFKQIHEDDYDRLMESIVSSESSLTTWTCRFRAIHPTRGVIWLSGSSTPKRLKDGSTSWIGVVNDVTVDTEREIALKRAHELAEEMRVENERLALLDSLTGLPNRRCFDKFFESRISDAQSGGANDLCLMRIDLDKFKYINDTFGHDAGDQTLKHVSNALQKSVRESDLVARIGGDEFSVMLHPASTESSAQTVAERFKEKLTEPLSLGGRKIYITASIGIAYTNDLREHGSKLPLEADTALYASKNSGRNRVQTFSRAMQKTGSSGHALAADLPEAILNGQFVPFFQPQVSASDHRLVGVETLMRWEHPTEGLVGPDRFIPIAEQMQLLSEIDHIVYRKSLEVLSDLEMEGISVPKISFNISADRIRDHRILLDAEEVNRFPNTTFTFELLESILVEEEGPDFRSTVGALKDMGIELEIDDFGSGHSSILSILTIEPSALKIDRRLVTPLGQDRKYSDIIEGIIRISQSLGISTVAEGVETEQQAAMLAAAGCDVLQGYLFAKPLPADDLRSFLSNRPVPRTEDQEPCSKAS